MESRRDKRSVAYVVDLLISGKEQEALAVVKEIRLENKQEVRVCR